MVSLYGNCCVFYRKVWFLCTATAVSFIGKYGFFDPRTTICSKRGAPGEGLRSHSDTEQIGAVILDDGMQQSCFGITSHLSLARVTVMVNGLQPWGNCRLVPLGPLRESLSALQRADIAIVHNADLVPGDELKSIERTIREVTDSIQIFFTRMAPAYFFEVGNISSVMPLDALSGNIVICVSAIGSATVFVQGVEKDIHVIKKRLVELESQFGTRPIIVITEKDFDRDPEILKHFGPFRVWAVCAKLQFVSREGCAEDQFKNALAKLLTVKLRGCRTTPSYMSPE